MLKTTVDDVVRPSWSSELNWICPSGDIIVELLKMDDSGWKLKPAKKICCADNGFSSGCVSIGDCVWTQDKSKRDLILQITHVGYFFKIVETLFCFL